MAVGLQRTGRAVTVRVAGEARWIAAEDVARFRDALGAMPPPGVPQAYLEPVADPLGDLVSRYARTHGPFTAAGVAHRFGLGVAPVIGTLDMLAAAGKVVHGAFRPGGSGTEWCTPDVLRRLRRRTLARLRHECGNLFRRRHWAASCRRGRPWARQARGPMLFCAPSNSSREPEFLPARSNI